MSFGWGIISTGRHPNRKMAPAINAAKDGTLVAVYSRDMGRAQAFSAKHGAEVAYDDLAAFLAHPGLDIVYIASPNFLHASQTIMAAQAGKHVLCEKPMALTEAEGKAMIEACQSNGVKLGIGFHLRHHPGHVEARRLIQSGALGIISLAQAQFASGVAGVVMPGARTGLEEWWDHPEMVGAGTMMGSGVHAVDLLRFLLGQEVVEVSAISDGHTQARPLEHLAAMLLRFDKGAIGVAYCGRRVPYSQNDAVVYGSQGRVSIRGSLDTVFQGTLEIKGEGLDATQTYERDDISMYTREVEDFQRGISEGKDHTASGWDGLKVIQITDAYNESARTGRRVFVPKL